MNSRATSVWTFILLVGAFAPVAVALAIGHVAAIEELPTWYDFLPRPRFKPPGWLFVPLWTLFYLLIGLAFFRVLSAPGRLRGRRLAIALFVAQGALNATWAWTFMGAKSLLAGMVVVIALTAVVAGTTRAFFRIDRVAGWCMVPYLAWVAFVTVVNATLWFVYH